MRRPRLAPVLLLLLALAAAAAGWAAVTGRTAALLGRAPAGDPGNLEALGQYGDVPDFAPTNDDEVVCHSLR